MLIKVEVDLEWLSINPKVNQIVLIIKYHQCVGKTMLQSKDYEMTG